MVSGGPNNDVLVAGKGSRTLTGGSGSDTFDFGKQGTNAVIMDFNVQQDKLEFEAPLVRSGQPFLISSDHGNTLIQGKDFSAELKGVTPSQLSAKDFTSPSQSELVSNNVLLTQFAAAGFQNTSTTPNGSSSAPIAASENLATVMSDSVLAPSTPHLHA
jgi:Ca2+-binding RTX toxin-like protein